MLVYFPTYGLKEDAIMKNIFPEELYSCVGLLEKKIGYTFADKSLAANALTHSSFYNEHKKDTVSNERLEFLGDSVLSLIMCEYLYAHDNRDEGKLTKVKAALVCEESLYGFAKRINLGECICFGRGDREEGKQRPSSLADAVEAILGAVYLDGGMDEARKMILPYLVESLKNYDIGSDYKTMLQEVVQKNKGELLTYEITGESGPAHDKRFECSVFINSNVIAQGVGHSKKAAEQDAAKKALVLLGITL